MHLKCNPLNIQLEFIDLSFMIELIYSNVFWNLKSLIFLYLCTVYNIKKTWCTIELCGKLNMKAMCNCQGEP